MELSVVVPTLNGRETLGDVLDTLGDRVPDAELVVVNGPSSDGTSGLVRRHAAVDRLVEVAERNLNAARNAGIAAAGGDVVAFVGQSSSVQAGWLRGLTAGVDSGADVVAGPVRRAVAGGHTTEQVEHRSFAGRQVTFFDGGNVAFTAAALAALDGFDEYLPVGGARDAAHRLAGLGRTVTWQSEMAVLRDAGQRMSDRITGEADDPARGLQYRALAYRLAKNYGFRPTVVAHALREAGRDALSVLGDVVRGEATPSTWAGTGRSVLANIATGTEDGFRARASDAAPRRNPNGLSTRTDRAVTSVEP